jgi:hypothetical protein
MNNIEEMKKQHKLEEENIFLVVKQSLNGKTFDEIYVTILDLLEEYTSAVKKGSVESFVEIDASLNCLFNSTEEITAEQQIKLNIIQNKLKEATDYLKIQRQEILNQYKKNNISYGANKEYLKNMTLFSED